MDLFAAIVINAATGLHNSHWEASYSWAPESFGDPSVCLMVCICFSVPTVFLEHTLGISPLRLPYPNATD